MTTNQKVLGLLGLCSKSGEITFGTDACIDIIKRNKTNLVLVASDASDRTKRNFEFVCNQNNIKICIFGTIEEISKAIGRVNKAVLAIKNDSLASQIYKIINGGDIIG